MNIYRSRARDLPVWLYGSLTVLVFVIIGVVGLYLTRGWVRSLHVIPHSHNDIVGIYLGAVTVIYGIALALLALATWSNYVEVEGNVDHEAIALGGLYRDITSFPEPVRGTLQNDLRKYTRQIIDVAWPMQRRGIVPNNASDTLDEFREHFKSFEPTTEHEKILIAELYRVLNELTESRRARLNRVTAEMPGPLWTLVIAGALTSIGVSWFIDAASFSLHLWMTILFTALLGLMIFLVDFLDNPYRGKASVTPEPLERVYQQIMNRAR